MPTLAEGGPTGSGRSELGASVRALRPRAGSPNLRKYDDGRLVPQFTNISKALVQAGVDEKISNERELSRLTGRLIGLVDAILGLDVPVAERPELTKPPARLFEDYRRDGSLQCMLLTCFQFREERGWSSFDFRDKGRHKEHVELLTNIDRALRAGRFYNLFKVFLTPDLGEAETETLREYVQKHGGVIVSASDVATHLVYPDPRGTTEHETDAQVLLRYLSREGKPGGVRALVHWWYHPDSYDDWIMAKDVVGALEEPRTRKKESTWHVQARWVRDLERFNEWMNELDYEMPVTFDKHAEQSATVLDGGEAARPNVRLRLRMSEEPEGAPPSKRMRDEVAGFRFVGLPSISGAADETLNNPEAPPPDEPKPTDGPDGAIKGAKVESSVGDAGEAQLAKKDTAPETVDQADAVTIPEFSSWFHLDKIHDIERRSMSEFFSGDFPSKTSTVYKDTRDFMIQTWRRAPKRYLTATAARRNLRGDACGILRIHDFLEHWGLINYNVDADTIPPPVSVPPPPPLPTEAGRMNAHAGHRRMPLFLEDGTPVDIHEHKVRKVTLDGTPLQDVVPGVDFANGFAAGLLVDPNSVLQSAIVHEQHGSPSTRMDLNMQTPEAEGGLRTRSLRPERSVRSTRSSYGRSARRRRTSRYVEEDSSDIDDEDDDVQDEDDESDDGNEPAPGEPTDPVGAPETREQTGGEEAIEYHCDVCSRDCSRVRYHCATRADMDLCPTCYSQGKYPSTMQPRDFIQMTAAPTGDGVKSSQYYDPHVWSESETLLLLEALEMYGDNWEMVAEHVASKDLPQCVLQFLRLPIEDGFVGSLNEKWWPAGALGSTVPSMSPKELLQKLGVREEALARVGDTASARHVLSGEPLMCSDHRNTVTPHAALLAALVPRDPAQDLFSEARLAASSVEPDPAQDTEMTTPKDEEHDAQRSRQMEDLARLVHHLYGAGGQAQRLGSDPQFDTESCISDALYQAALNRIPSAPRIAESATGLSIAQAALARLQNGGTADGGTADGDAVDGDAVDGDAVDGDAVDGEGQMVSGDAAGDNSNATPIAVGKDDELDGQRALTNPAADVETPSARPFTEIEPGSSRSVAVTAMASLVARARELAAAESLELDRLHVLVGEVKLHMIGLKLKHLESIQKHKRLSDTRMLSDAHEPLADRFSRADAKFGTQTQRSTTQVAVVADAGTSIASSDTAHGVPPAMLG